MDWLADWCLEGGHYWWIFVQLTSAITPPTCAHTEWLGFRLGGLFWKDSAAKSERRRILKHKHIQGTSRKVVQCNRIFVYLCTRLLCQGSGKAGEVPVYSNRHSVTKSVCPTGTVGQKRCMPLTGHRSSTGKFTLRLQNIKKKTLQVRGPRAKRTTAIQWTFSALNDSQSW